MADEPSLPGVVCHKRGVFQAPGAEAHGVVDNFDCCEVRLLPAEPDGSRAVGLCIDLDWRQWRPLLHRGIWGAAQEEVWRCNDSNATHTQQNSPN